MGLDGALTGEEKLKELEKKKLIIFEEFSKIIEIVSEGLGSQHDCFITTNIKIDIIPNEKTK